MTAPPDPLNPDLIASLVHYCVCVWWGGLLGGSRVAEVIGVHLCPHPAHVVPVLIVLRLRDEINERAASIRAEEAGG